MIFLLQQKVNQQLSYCHTSEKAGSRNWMKPHALVVNAMDPSA